MPATRFQDDKGNRSSMREALYILIIVEVLLLVVWCLLAFIEVKKEVSDWTGLSYVLAAIIAIGGLASLAKSVQKKFEQHKPHPPTRKQFE